MRSKEKREQWKLESAKIALSQKLVEEAKQIKDVMTLIEPFRKFDRNGLSVSISSERASTMDLATFEWAFDITEKNMKNLYESCEWGWKDKEKRSELQESDARFLIARNTMDNKPVGYVHFRFDLDDDVEVIYCYEIQLENSVRKKGLGKFLMQILELLSLKTKMKKVVATVLKHNEDSRTFFEKLKYTIDDTNPDDQVSSVMNDIEYSYIIISKEIGVKAK